VNYSRYLIQTLSHHWALSASTPVSKSIFSRQVVFFKRLLLGVDYTHPSLGGAFGPGNKIAGGFDFVGDNYDGQLFNNSFFINQNFNSHIRFIGTNTPVPDADPLDKCNGHGTHVSVSIVSSHLAELEVE
jgi:subtilisin family serine protease